MGKKYKYTHYDEDKRKNEKKFLCKFRKAVYSILDIPTYWNIIYTNTEIFDLIIECALRHSFIEDMTNKLNRDEKTVCDADTVYYRLKKLDITEWTERFRKANDTLLKMAQKQKIIGLKPSACVDVHPVMCYGDKDAFGVRDKTKKRFIIRV